MMIPGGALAERKAVDEVLGFRACVVRRYVSHFLSFPQVLSYSPPKEELNMQVLYNLRQCPAFCIDESTTLPLTFTRILILMSMYSSAL